MSLKKACLIFSAVILFSLINIGLAQAGTVVIKVQYQDYCPRSNAMVRDITTNYWLYDTNESGYTSETYFQPDKVYRFWAYWPDFNRFGLEEMVLTDLNGDGSGILENESILDSDGNLIGDCHQPQWQNQGQSSDSIGNLQSNYLYAQAKSYQVDYAWLWTNETGVDGKNYTDGTYGSPMDMSDATDWAWSNFTWSNPSFVGTLEWKIYYNDTDGFVNSTDSLSFTVKKADQTITFGSLSDKTYGDSDFAVSATASSGLTVSFAASGSCSMAGATTVHITGAGSCTITASQSGDSNYNAAPDVPQSFTINKSQSGINLFLNGLNQNITVEAGNITSITAVLTSGGSDIYLYQDDQKINGGTSPLTNLTTYSSVGAYNITVVYPGDENYNPSSETHFITVQDMTPPTYSNVVEPPDPSVYNPAATYTFSINWTDNVAVDKVIMQMDGINYTTFQSGDTYSLTFASCQSSTPVGGGGSGHFYLTSVGPIIPLLLLISIFLSFLVRIKKKYNVLAILFIALIINLFFVSVSGADPPSCLSIRPHSYRWYANDTSGNWNSTNPMSFTINGTDPVSVYIISPENKTYSTSSVNVNYSIDSPFEISWIGYSLDNKPNITLTRNTTLNIAEGSHNMIFYANTTWGVMNSSQRVYFTVSLPKPDLVIGDILTSGNTISYSIKNQGNANAGSSYSNLYVDDSYKAQDSISSLAIGSTSNRAFSYSWTCSGTSDTIKVCADANNNVVESNENNNCLTKIFTCPAPLACTCTAWVNTYNLCTGTVNGCYYKYVRTCSPNGCGQQSQCVYGGKYCAV